MMICCLGHRGCEEGSKVENELELQQYLEQASLQVPVGSIALQPKWIKSGPYNLKKNAFLYVGRGTLYPKFAKIKNMFIVDSQIFIQLQSCETISFDSLYNSFVVQVLSREVCCVKDLPALDSCSSCS